MTAAWMLWSIGAGLLFLVAGLAAERLLNGGRRWVWAAAGAGTVLLPAVRLLSSGGRPEALPAGPPIALEPLAITVSRDSALHSLDETLLFGWVVLSSLLMVAALVAAARFVRRRRSWEAGELLRRDVLWSRRSGPAVVGLLRSSIVLPEWVRGAGEARQELILTHEEEHLKAHDVQLRFLAAALLVAFPWNPALWFQYRRLGLALDIDCDRRVIKRWPQRLHLYGDLLLRVGARGGNMPGIAVAALAEQPSLLERRIRALLRKAPEIRMAQAAFLVFGAILVIGIAVMSPGITSDGADLSSEPAFTPFTVAPDYTNASEVRRALESEYPPLLRDAGIGGTVLVWFFIDEAGTVRNSFVNESSGSEALDEAALRVAPVFKFTPALNRDRAVPVWVSLPITFTSQGGRAAEGEGAETEAAEAAVTEAGAGPDPSAGPVVTPYTVAPDYTNPSEIRQAMESEYPPLFRDAGIGGTVQVWFFIDESGEVREAAVKESSGSEALDEAALRVAPVFKFTPAMNRDRAVPVWVSLPITFTTR
ncbi:MAG: M56 family metallopeptidase [Gemmatimonadetes bacterium]|nr:M56 family metallopeptidase [Gemmatimonadota bacterium]